VTRGFLPRLRRGPVATVALAAGCGLNVGCAEESTESGRPVLSVFAASSLTEVFQEVEEEFEARHPEWNAVLAFAGSQILRFQIEHGAQADLFASADTGHLQALRRAGLAGDAQRFAENELAVIVPPDNPAQIEVFSDLLRAERLVLGTAAVPVGAYARAALAKADEHLGSGFAAAVLARVVSEESNARLLRAKVALGEADAAIVYRTDALAGQMRTVAVPKFAAVRTEYGIARLAGNRPGPPAHEAADAWVAFLLSPDGQAVLARRGFLPGTPAIRPNSP